MFLNQNKEAVDKTQVTFETSSMFFLVIFTEILMASPQRCIRPQDMANFNLVKSYRTCVLKMEKHCKANEKDLICKTMQRPMDFRQRFPENVSLIKPQERCSVLKDGSYECVLDPIRFIVKEEPKPAPGTGILPGGSPVPVNAGGAAAPTPAGSPGAPTEQGQPVLPPIPPPPPPTPSN